MTQASSAHTMVDEIGARASAQQRRELVDEFTLAARYERRFADAAFRLESGR